MASTAIAMCRVAATLLISGSMLGPAMAGSPTIPLDDLRQEAQRAEVRPSLVLALIRAESECGLHVLPVGGAPTHADALAAMRPAFRRLGELRPVGDRRDIAVYTFLAGEAAAELGTASAEPQHVCVVAAVRHWEWPFCVYDPPCPPEEFAAGYPPTSGRFRDWDYPRGGGGRWQRGGGLLEPIDGRP